MSYIVKGKELNMWITINNGEPINEDDLFRVHDNGDITKLEKRGQILNCPERKRVLKAMTVETPIILEEARETIGSELDFDIESYR